MSVLPLWAGFLAFQTVFAVRFAPLGQQFEASRGLNSGQRVRAIVLTADDRRLKFFQEHWHNHTQTPLQVVRGPHLSEQHTFDRDVSPLWHLLEPKEKIGAMLVAEGHRRIFETIATSEASETQWFAIFEDDARLDSRLDLDAVAQNVPADAYLLQLWSHGIADKTRLGWSCRSPTAVAHVQSFTCGGNCFCYGAVAYMVTKASAKEMLVNMYPLEHPIDIAMWQRHVGVLDRIQNMFGVIAPHGVYVVDGLPIKHGRFPSLHGSANRNGSTRSPVLLPGLPDAMLLPGLIGIAALVALAALVSRGMLSSCGLSKKAMFGEDPVMGASDVRIQ